MRTLIITLLAPLRPYPWLWGAALCGLITLLFIGSCRLLFRRVPRWNRPLPNAQLWLGIATCVVAIGLLEKLHDNVLALGATFGFCLACSLVFWVEAKWFPGIGRPTMAAWDRPGKRGEP